MPEIFEKMPGLESLWFAIYSDAYEDFSDEAPPLQRSLDEHIERLHMEKLERLCLYSVSDKSLKLLKCCPRLKHLTIQSHEFTRQGLAEPAALPELETLNLLHHRSFKDDDLAALAEMKSLRSLGLAWLNVEGHGLLYLKDLPNLEELRLYGSFNDSALESLERFPRSLTVFLLMSKSNISEAALAEFRRKHPLWTILPEEYDIPLRLELE